MATEDEGGGMEDVERTLEEDRERESFFGSISESLGNLKDRYVGFHTVDEESERWGDQQAVNNISRRGFLSLAGQTAVAGYAVAEATDNDGWEVDWSSGQEEPGIGPIGAPGNGNAEEPGAVNGENHLGVQGDVSDELYLQEDGTVITIDYGHKEWRAFPPEEFSENSDYADLHSELEGEREATELAPPGLTSGIEVSKQELFDYDTTAYEDMADESEWDLIFDSNPAYDGSQ